MQEQKIPYPDLEGIGEDEKALKIISPAYAGDESELTAILQYAYQSVSLQETGREDMASKLKTIAMDEMRHAEILGRLIVRLGTRPVFSYFPPYPIRFFTARSVRYATTLKKMLSDSIEGEQYAVDGYSRMLARLTDEKIRAVITRIRADELAHLEMLKKAAEEI